MRVSVPWICAALHAIAAVGTVTLLRGGSEAVRDVSSRAAWIQSHPWQWRAGWLLWMAAAASLLLFYRWWAVRTGSPRAVAAVAVAAMGLVSDFSGELIFIVAVPAPGSGLHRLASLLTGGLGNALYTIAGVYLTVITPALPRYLRIWAWLVWLSGFALTAATVADVPFAVVLSSAALMVLFIPWVVTMSGVVRLR